MVGGTQLKFLSEEKDEEKKHDNFTLINYLRLFKYLQAYKF